MPVSNKAWGQINASDYADADAYCKACLIDLNPAGQDKVQANCKLPVYEPGGALNRNAVHAAAGALAGARGGVQAPSAVRRKSARSLVRLYRELDEEPPEAVRRLAGG